MEERMVAKIVANNEKFEVHRGTLLDEYPPSQDRNHARKNGHQLKGNERRLRTHERRNEGLAKRDEEPPRDHDGGLSRKDGNHGVGGKSRRNNPSRSIVKSLMKGPKWKLSEHWRTDVGTGI
jgi:hypothetical protein